MRVYNGNNNAQQLFKGLRSMMLSELKSFRCAVKIWRRKSEIITKGHKWLRLSAIKVANNCGMHLIFYAECVQWHSWFLEHENFE
jgi:hypothetical protein